MRHKSIFLFTVSVLVVALSMQFINRNVSAAPYMQMINKVYITNIWEGGFTVSWTTETAMDGHVDYGTDESLGNTASDGVASTTTHIVEISGLSADTDYLFQVRSGTTTDNNGGVYYNVHTGSFPAAPLPPGTHNLWGYLYDSSSNAVSNAIVYLQIQDVDSLPSLGNSTWVSARTDSDGVWHFNLFNVRTSDNDEFFSFTEGVDNVRIIWQGGAFGVVGEVGNENLRTIPAANTQIDITLDGEPNVINLFDFNAQSDHMTEITNILLILGLVLAIVYAVNQKIYNRF